MCFGSGEPPALRSGIAGDLRSRLWAHVGGARRSAFAAHCGGGRVPSIIRIAVLDLARGDIDSELGELRGIARALGALHW
jgi:hypothetical protein